MTPVFLIWFKATTKRNARIKRQFEYNKPKGIV